jgi:hypothetical protein
VKLDEELRLPAVLGTKASTAEYENHGMLPLQLRELAAFGGVVSEFVVGKERAGNDIGSHVRSSFSIGCVRWTRSA